MDCALILSDLVGYHFATLDRARRSEVDAHLLGCSRCLRSYLELKHHMDTGEDAPQRPSPEARSRLREAVAAEIAKTAPPPNRLSGLLRLQVPLYGTLAAAAFAALLALVVPRLLDAQHVPAVLAEGLHVDTSREIPISEQLY